MKKLMFIALLSATVGSAWTCKANAQRTSAPRINSGRRNVQVSPQPDGKLLLSGVTVVNGEEKPFTVRLLRDGKTFDKTYGKNGMKMTGTN